MNENGTVQQLSKALNQLLDAYETLQEEAKNLKEENTTLKEEIDDLELRNRGLDSRLCALNDTTKHTSSEMDTMLGRIETILGPTLLEEEKKEEEKIEPEPEIEEEEKEENNFYQDKDENKEIDLGRMQSLLNGFSN
ncbi:MAG: cell division protein ZapB [Arcobacteraceae bacterium]